MNNKLKTHNNIFDSENISSTLKSNFKKGKLIETLEDVKMFNSIKKLADSSNIDLDLCLHGPSIAIPVINSFIKFKDDIDLNKINHLQEESLTRGLFFSNNQSHVQDSGINALEIIYTSTTNKFVWFKNFEDFLNTKELRVTKWVNPIEQIIHCIILCKAFDCYFDLEHHIKAAATILFMDDELLNKFSIIRSQFENDQHIFLKKNLTNELNNKIFSSIEVTNEYQFKTNKGYPYIIPFARALPDSLGQYLTKAINISSSHTRKDFLAKFKQGSYFLKLLMIIFNKKDIPLSIENAFKKFYKNFKFKETLINNELKDISYGEFEKAIVNYTKITKDLNENLTSLRSLYQRNIVKELINHKDEAPGPIVKQVMGFIPDKNIFLKESVEFKGYEVSQVKSKIELISIGHEFGNCLRNAAEYHNSIRRGGHCFFIFRYKSRKRNFSSFIAYLNINNNKCDIYEMLRKNNASCTSEERAIVQELLMNIKLIDIPDEFFAHFTMHTFTEIASKNFEAGISGIIENAPTIYALLKKLKRSRHWFYNVDNQLLTDDVKKIVKNFIQKEYMIKDLTQ